MVSSGHSPAQIEFATSKQAPRYSSSTSLIMFAILSEGKAK